MDEAGAGRGENGAGAVAPDVTVREALGAFTAALALVVATRLPVARTGPVESDEFILVRLVGRCWFNIYHTLFIASGRLAGLAAGDSYRGFVYLDMLTSALALVAVWWLLRAVARPATSAAGAFLLALAPQFWGYGAVAGSYTMVAAVGSFLLGVAVRTWRDPRPWHPYAAAVVLAVGTGYRHDIGTLWLPVFLVTVWAHRWRRAAWTLGLFTALNLVWIALMLYEAGGWAAYRDATREFANEAGYKNSVWYLGLKDAPARYAVKLALALVWTFGPALLFVPRGAARLARSDRWLAALLVLSVLPALALHLLVHFGVPGYAFHEVPALAVVIALGIGRATTSGPGDRAPWRLAAVAGVLAAVFLFYPADFSRPGVRGDFDLACARHTRAGLNAFPPKKAPTAWRTANSRTPGREVGVE
jgi:hypothetical protein